MYAITGATGQLGRLALDDLLAKVPASEVVALVRDPARAADIAARGVAVRRADYDDPVTLPDALAGVTKLLFISGSEVGRRGPQHAALVAAAKAAEVGFIAYTSLLRADTSPMALAPEHVATEIALKGSGIAHTLLRNGWYTENYAASIAPAIAHGAFIGAARDGRIASAARRDYAAAAVAVLTDAEAHAGKTYELAGDESYTLADFAAAIARLSGKPVVYTDLSEADFAAALVSVGLPAAFADLLAESDAKAAEGALFDDSHTLSGLIGRPTTPYAEVIAETLAASAA
jgi:NAD(P)H dehydrogenase (quinone)